MAWAASPSRATRPTAQEGSGTTSSSTSWCRTASPLDQAELQAVGEQAGMPRDADELMDGLAGFVERRLAGRGRQRSLAHYACAVESVRHPELREILVPRQNAAREAVRAFLEARGVADAEGRTLTLLACVDGLVFDRLVGGGGVPRDEIAGLVAAALRDA
ncbi:TetR family transcriptional regulator C-terminal domain-containing protein [Streptomyces sp. NBC_01363]|uniref:TetR family transcriptional regulator C-terminal domain-containing protein n=1 Tax=Streptomyces sp. NBC_01363 TaxID=2903840 RepID=UPI002256D7DB|nr:TetR family transcriptional regulator C-terminal domain-containing protein [Streptomyces sp. NBC_01363]MCX4736486.1 TetR family transcriptional regulator C-terminal domain-containing protein [Streptomyces sp. NBC_01363]